MKLIRDLPMRELDVDVSGEITTRQTINFKMATYLCKRFLRDPSADGDLLLHEIAKFVEPVRPDRSDERKIQPKSFRGFVYRVPA